MSRYIDADKAYETAKNYHKDFALSIADLTSLREVLEDTPTADVEKVVRCKDCKYWRDKNSKSTQGVCLCGNKDMNYNGEFYPFADDFCSYGERKMKNDK